jgi:hypothetical protein
MGGIILVSIDLPRDTENWHRRFVMVWLALRRLLPLLAVLSLALTPVTASAAAAGMHASMAVKTHAGHAAMPAMDDAGLDMAAVDADDMPCCPPKTAPQSDCPKAACPLMALCLASIASLLPAAVPVLVPVATRAAPARPDAASFTSLHGSPLPEPPRA